MTKPMLTKNTDKLRQEVAAAAARADARLPQRDLLLRLISEAPVVEALDD